MGSLIPLVDGTTHLFAAPTMAALDARYEQELPTPIPATPAAATDLPTALTLVNKLRSDLLALGLIT